MTNPMLAELDAVVRLMEAATPGLLQPEFVEAYNVRAAHGGIFAQIHNLKGRHGMGGRVDGNEAANNARLIASAINFLRTHHATLADMAKRMEAAERDVARIDWLESKAHMLTWNDNAEHVAIRAEDGAEGTGESWREAIDAAIDATQEGEG